jgi:Flp pilus assembly protein TadD
MIRQIKKPHGLLSNKAMLPAALVLAATIAACQTTRSNQTPLFGNSASQTHTGSISHRGDMLVATTKLARKWQKNNGDATIGMQYAAQLKAIGSYDKALAILRQTSMRNPQNQTVLFVYGNQLAAMKQLAQAQSVLQKAHSVGKPNWKIYAAQGAVLDQMGQHDRAQVAHSYALKLAPGKPAIINNIAMSYVMAGKLKRAEDTMRPIYKHAGSNSRIRQNMALIVGLQGRFKEAEKIAAADLPPQDVKANIAYLRQMLRQPNNWETVKKLNKT